MKELDYLFINGAVTAKSISLFRENEYQALVTSKMGFFKTLIDFGYTNLDYKSIDEVIEQGYVDLKEYLNSVTQSNEVITKFFFFRFDISNIIVLLKGKLVDKKGVLNNLGWFSQTDITNILLLNDYTKLNDELEFFENVKLNCTNLCSFQLSNLVIKEGYKYLYDHIAIENAGLLQYLNYEVTIKNVLTLYRMKRLEGTIDALNDSIIPFGFIEKKVFENLFNLGKDEISSHLRNLFNTEFVDSLERLNQTNNLEAFSRDLIKLKLNILKDILRENEQLGTLLHYVFSKELEFANIKSLYLDSNNLKNVIY